jgi:hypothetical protein
VKRVAAEFFKEGSGQLDGDHRLAHHSSGRTRPRVAWT